MGVPEEGTEKGPLLLKGVGGKNKAFQGRGRGKGGVRLTRPSSNQRVVFRRKIALLRRRQSQKETVGTTSQGEGTADLQAETENWEMHRVRKHGVASREGEGARNAKYGGLGCRGHRDILIGTFCSRQKDNHRKECH